MGTRSGSGMDRRQDRAKMRWSAEMERRATERSRVKTHGGVESEWIQTGRDAEGMNAE